MLKSISFSIARTIFTQCDNVEDIVKHLADLSSIDYKTIYEARKETSVRKMIKKHKFNSKLSYEKNYQALEKHHVIETKILSDRIEQLNQELKWAKDDLKALKKKLPRETVPASEYYSSNNPIQTGPFSYTCGHCHQPMYYDGRCGDGPVCVNNGCYSRIQAAAYWNDSR